MAETTFNFPISGATHLSITCGKCNSSFDVALEKAVEIKCLFCGSYWDEARINNASIVTALATVLKKLSEAKGTIEIRLVAPLADGAATVTTDIRRLLKDGLA